MDKVYGANGPGFVARGCVRHGTRGAMGVSAQRIWGVELNHALGLVRVLAC